MNDELFRSDIVTVLSVRCDIRRSGPSTSYGVTDTFVGVPIRGIFTMHAWRAEHLLHPMLAVVLPANTEYKMSHPTDDGDDAVVMRFAPEIVAEALGETSPGPRVTRPDMRLRHAVGLLVAGIGRREAPSAIDELFRSDIVTVLSVRCDIRREKIDRVRMVLAERPDRHWTLQELAGLVDYSPFHLSHQFRAFTGTSVHRYLADLRATAALARIEARDDASFATIAADLGFAHHSHLTATLRRRLGLTPRMIREGLYGKRAQS
ncbi:MAG: hypothetical protein AUH85_11415 [Chloroflexi bacterium 13_1_40CM_4_68_4]|nr:MAG: hypothetical protein AUH85_11415 [Chloroflexi bacterium 13_1_40CM_4_68_4]